MISCEEGDPGFFTVLATISANSKVGVPVVVGGRFFDLDVGLGSRSLQNLEKCRQGGDAGRSPVVSSPEFIAASPIPRHRARIRTRFRQGLGRSGASTGRGAVEVVVVDDHPAPCRVSFTSASRTNPPFNRRGEATARSSRPGHLPFFKRAAAVSVDHGEADASAALKAIATSAMTKSNLNLARPPLSPVAPRASLSVREDNRGGVGRADRPVHHSVGPWFAPSGRVGPPKCGLWPEPCKQKAAICRNRCRHRDPGGACAGWPAVSRSSKGPLLRRLLLPPEDALRTGSRRALRHLPRGNQPEGLVPPRQPMLLLRRPLGRPANRRQLTGRTATNIHGWFTGLHFRLSGSIRLMNGIGFLS